jgi:hypothetical protein
MYWKWRTLCRSEDKSSRTPIRHRADEPSTANRTFHTDRREVAAMTDGDRTARNGEITATYAETSAERVLAFECEDRTAAIAQNREGYAMLKVRTAPDGDELERYYGFDVALDHAAELLGCSPHDLPVPDAAEDMGM